MLRWNFAESGTRHMKSVVKLDRYSRVKARYLLPLVMGAFRSVVVMRYCLAAQRHEKNGSSFAAALEWRKAAELVGSIGPMANRCWIEWERIMHLPRRLAGPIA
jgi:hypothetical protein